MSDPGAGSIAVAGRVRVDRPDPAEPRTKRTPAVGGAAGAHRLRAYASCAARWSGPVAYRAARAVVGPVVGSVDGIMVTPGGGWNRDSVHRIAFL